MISNNAKIWIAPIAAVKGSGSRANQGKDNPTAGRAGAIRRQAATGRRAARRISCNLLVACAGIYLVTGSLASAADEKTSLVIPDEISKYAIHDYTARSLLSLWFVYVEGEYETENALGNSVSVTFDKDLGYDDPYETFIGDIAFRWGKHDFWITGTRFDEEETSPIGIEFEIDDEVFNIGGDVSTDVSFTDIDFRYGYSFFDFEQDGFRLGPTIAVSYTDVSIEVVEVSVAGQSVDARASYEESLPVPTIGVHAEVPYDRFLFSGSVGAFYFDDSSSFEGAGVRGLASVTWRPFDHVGFFAGVKGIYADIDTGSDKIDDLLLWGPTFGLELRL